MASVTLFAGPSAHGLPPPLRRLRGIRWLPPVRRGDIDRLRASARQPATVVVCDGVFQAAPAVSHAELCRALDAGWQVWGVSSIGAIRAHELRAEGMRGFGWVHAQFTQHDDFTDDELCLLHFPEAPYFPVSEALVNLRYAFAERGAELGIGAAAQRRTLSALRARWFGDRTELRMRELMQATAGIAPARADALLAWLRLHRVKTLDLAALLLRRPWQDPLRSPAPSTGPQRPSSSRPRD